MAYNHVDWIAKAMALIWATFLCIGGDLVTLSFFWSKVRSITTDYGVELSCQMIVDVLPAFLLRVSGRVQLATCVKFINAGSRLMRNCLRIGGWSHSLSHVMESACKTVASWPDKLSKMRCLCRVWRNTSYRKHLSKKAFGGGVENVSKTLENFTAGFAKWRFETIYDVLRQLLGLRLVAEQLDRSYFEGVADEGDLRDFLKYCRDAEHWRWMAVWYKNVIMPLEKLRRWGLLCPCHEPERLAGDFSTKHCMWNSRRLREVPNKIDTVCRHSRHVATNLTLEDCEGDPAIQSQVVSGLRASAGDLDERTRYTRSVPWSFASADTPDGAANCLAQWESIPPCEHDSLTVDTMAAFEDDIKAVASGQDCSRRWSDEVQSFCTAPLDESAGEGYHRSTHHVVTRAPGAGEAYIKQSVRVDENIRVARSFIIRHKRAGRRILRFEWYNLTRVLQTGKQKRWKPVKMKLRSFFARIYRQDDMASDDWSSFLAKLKPGCVPSAEVPKERWVEELAREYLGALFQPLCYYTYPTTQESMDGSGALVQQTTTRAVQVLRINTGSRRTHTIATWRREKADAKLALRIQPLAIWQESETGLHVYSDGDPHWAEPTDLASFTVLRTQLKVSYCVSASGDSAQCQALQDFKVAVPMMPLTDKKCPTLLVLGELKRTGWRQSPTVPVIHDANMEKLCDTRGGTSMKPYLQCLLNLERSLQFTTVMPSGGNQSYYRCILSGKRAEASMSDHQCKAALLDVDPCLVPLEDGALAIADGSAEPTAILDGDEDMVVVVGSSPLPAAAAKKARFTQTPFLPLPDGFVLVGGKAVPKVAPPPAPAPLVWEVPLAEPIHSPGGLPAIGLPPLPPPPDAPPSPPPHDLAGFAHVDGGEDDGIVIPAPVAAKAAAFPVFAGGKRMRDWIDFFDGRITMDRYDPNLGVGYVNFILKFEHGRNWEKKRVVNHASTALHGQIEPLGFLHAFMLGVRSGTFLEARCKPSSAEVDSCVASNREAYAAVVAHFS